MLYVYGSFTFTACQHPIGSISGPHTLIDFVARFHHIRLACAKPRLEFPE